MLSKASVFAGIVYVIIYVYFNNLFGETPVNLFRLGGGDAASNLIFNTVTYVITTVVICVTPLTVLKNKKKLFYQVVVGSLAAASLMLLYTILSLTFTWKQLPRE